MVNWGRRAFWSVPATEILSSLQAAPGGLSGAEAARRLAVAIFKLAAISLY
ncbi:MAG: hypothetical protein QHH75_12115 [Bacillota bacterium]|nr:hypothetical protein [Bacillota bacterium]